jgi:hypothetical protein
MLFVIMTVSGSSSDTATREATVYVEKYVSINSLLLSFTF